MPCCASVHPLTAPTFSRGSSAGLPTICNVRSHHGLSSPRVVSPRPAGRQGWRQAPLHAAMIESRPRVLIVDDDIAIVLADQRMPDMSGLELLSEVRRLKPTAVGVLITAHADLEDAMRAINSVRVLGFLAKPWDESELLGVMQRALDAHFALREFARPRAPEHELSRLQSLVGAPAPITSQRFGVLPMRDSMPAEFERLSRAYSDILGMALDQRAFKVDHQTSQALQELADQLGMLSAGP